MNLRFIIEKNTLAQSSKSPLIGLSGFFCTFLIVFLSISGLRAQSINGQWLGGFTSADNADGGKTDFVLELDLKGNEISGYSYTYFTITGKRYYVICKLKGNYEKESKSLSIKEIETVKTNTPPDFQNCLQQHQLTYFRKDDKEYLLGKWKPNQPNGNCGKGETQMERSVLKHFGPEKQTQTNSITRKEDKKQIETPDVNVKNLPSVSKPKNVQTPEALKTEPINNNFKPTIDSKSNQLTEVRVGKMLSDREKEKLTERTRQLLKTIDVSGPSFKVDIYDNGQIDGDTVTIFLNDKLLVHAQKLTATPISFEIKIDPDEDIYDLVMYAESMGTIPPNTAFMVVTTSTNRYEINITSTEQTSGAIRFRVKR